MNHKPLIQRYLERTKKEGDCLIWMGDKYEQGYGRITLYPSKQNKRAHRVIYEIMRGPIAPTEYLTHTCKRRDCVRLDHLVLKLKRDSILEGTSIAGVNSKKTHCIRGHPLSGSNLRYRKKKTKESGIQLIRLCRACIAAYKKQYKLTL